MIQDIEPECQKKTSIPYFNRKLYSFLIYLYILNILYSCLWSIEVKFYSLAAEPSQGAVLKANPLLIISVYLENRKECCSELCKT